MFCEAGQNSATNIIYLLLIRDNILLQLWFGYNAYTFKYTKKKLHLLKLESQFTENMIAWFLKNEEEIIIKSERLHLNKIGNLDTKTKNKIT